MRVVNGIKPFFLGKRNTDVKSSPVSKKKNPTTPRK